MPDESCKTCRFWNKDAKDTEDHDNGEPLPGATYHSYCRRFPPITGDYGDFIEAEKGSFIPGFPVTLDYEWCGEYQPAPEPPPTTDG